MQDRFMILFMIVLAHISRLWGVECQYRNISQDRLAECSRSLWEVLRIEHKSLLEKHQIVHCATILQFHTPTLVQSETGLKQVAKRLTSVLELCSLR